MGFIDAILSKSVVGGAGASFFAALPQPILSRSVLSGASKHADSIDYGQCSRDVVSRGDLVDCSTDEAQRKQTARRPGISPLHDPGNSDGGEFSWWFFWPFAIRFTVRFGSWCWPI